MAALFGGAGAYSLPAVPAPFDREVLPLLQKYCWDCHADGMKKGDLALDPFKSATDVLRHRKEWDGILFNLDNWLMPPPKKDQPTPEERAKLVHWIDATLNPVDPANPDPGRVTIRRLNRAEYNNTVRDLLGVDLNPADSFPEDDSGYGFDNIGDVLAMPPVLLERYLMAADRLLDAAVVSLGSKARREEIRPDRLASDGEIGRHTGDGFILFAAGEASFRHEFPADAEYVLRLRVHAEQAGGEPAKMTVRVDGQDVKSFDVTGTARLPQSCELRFRAEKGIRPVAAAFLNDFYVRGQDRNLFIDLIEIEGPLRDKSAPLPESHRRIFIKTRGPAGSEAATREVVTAFTNRAFRRPARREEIDRLVGLTRTATAQNLPWEDAVKVALKAALVAPAFIYRIEWQQEPDNPARIADLSEFALASRLSYFLWSSMPDDRLLSLAFRNELRKNLAAEVRRMIADPKARELARHFGGQWLEIRNLEIVAPDRKRFRGFDKSLRRAMRRETEEFFHHLLTENRSVLDFLSADFTFVNERLARHYGIEGVTGEEFQRVALTPERRGVLTHASVLTVTSDPTRTSPVKRGKWVLENLLGTPPPPPPPNVPTIESSRHLTGTLRQKLEQHRANPACASCHSLLDPIGFGLENFDAIGSWRETEGDFPVDSHGRLTTGQEFRNAAELSQVLLVDKRDHFLRCLIGKLMTYSLGRGVVPADKPAINEIMAKSAPSQFAFQNVILSLVESVPFQKRRGDGFRAEPAAQ